MDKIDISYSYLFRMRLALLVGPLVVASYLAITYLHPANNQWMFDGSFEWSNFLRFVAIDQLLIESATYILLSVLIAYYGLAFRLVQVTTWSGITTYLVRFLPLLLIAFFFINPVTQTIRYLYHHFPNWNSELYFDSYFYSIPLYLTYLPPILIGGYSLIFANLFLNIKKNRLEKTKDLVNTNSIEVNDAQGKSIISLEVIQFIQRVDRETLLFTKTSRFRIKHTLNELEKILPENSFVRINRSVIIQLKEFKNFSFWENDKYILRLLGGNEFVVSRDRLRKIKEILKRGQLETAI